MRVKVAIIGGGPSGLLLARKLSLAGIECAVIERRSREYVLSRIRAGVLEEGTADQLRRANVGERMDSDGLIHSGCNFSDGTDSFHIDFRALSGKTVMVYGQTEVTRDLYDALDTSGVRVFHNAENLEISELETSTPKLTWLTEGKVKQLDCDFVAGCDGFHGYSRSCIPKNQRREYEKSYPFGWLGILSETPPVSNELIYSRSPRGFALASMRTPELSRYYIQVASDTDPADWTDTQFWNELTLRLPDAAAETLVTGPSIEKSVAPLRSFVCEPMSWGRLFLCGDAAHIVPPTGAKGLNLAASDVHYLFASLRKFYHDRSREQLKTYSQRALTRVWKSMRFSWWMTNMLHNFPNREPFDTRIQDSEFSFIRDSKAGQRALAENYTGLPY